MSISNDCCSSTSPTVCDQLTKFIAEAVTNVLLPEWEKAIQQQKNTNTNKNTKEPLTPYEKEWFYSFNYALTVGYVEGVCANDQAIIQSIVDFIVKYDINYIDKLAYACVNKCPVVVDSMTSEKFIANKYNRNPIPSNDKQSELREFVSSYSNDNQTLVSFKEFKIQRVTNSNFSISSKYSSSGVHLKSSGTNEMIYQEESGDIVTRVFPVASPVAEFLTGETDTTELTVAGTATSGQTVEGSEQAILTAGSTNSSQYVTGGIMVDLPQGLQASSPSSGSGQEWLYASVSFNPF